MDRLQETWLVSPVQRSWLALWIPLYEAIRSEAFRRFAPIFGHFLDKDLQLSPLRLHWPLFSFVGLRGVQRLSQEKDWRSWHGNTLVELLGRVKRIQFGSSRSVHWPRFRLKRQLRAIWRKIKRWSADGYRRVHPRKITYLFRSIRSGSPERIRGRSCSPKRISLIYQNYCLHNY